MGLENGTLISDLVPTNPTLDDSLQEGDDHIRLLKTVIKNDAVSQAQLATKEPVLPAGGTTLNYLRGDKTWQTLPAQDWGTLTGKPATFPPSTHSHPISDVTSLQTTLDGKAALSHTHTTAQVTGLDTALAGKEPTIAAGDPAMFWAGDKTWKTVSGGGSGLPNGLAYNPTEQSGTFTISAQAPHGQLIKITPRSDVIGSCVITGAGMYTFDQKIQIGSTSVATTVGMSRGGSAGKFSLSVDSGLLNLPHGTAPGTPVDGDIWTATGGLYARINGVTVGPLGTGGGGSSDWADITNKPSTFPPSTHSHAIADVTNLQTSLDAKEPTITAPGNTTTYWRGNKTFATLDKTAVGLGNVTNVAQEPTIAAGTTAQYWRGDKTWVAFPAIPADDVIGGIITISNTAPSSPAVGDVWIDTT